MIVKDHGLVTREPDFSEITAVFYETVPGVVITEQTGHGCKPKVTGCVMYNLCIADLTEKSTDPSGQSLYRDEGIYGSIPVTGSLVCNQVKFQNIVPGKPGLFVFVEQQACAAENQLKGVPGIYSPGEKQSLLR